MDPGIAGIDTSTNGGTETWKLPKPHKLKQTPHIQTKFRLPKWMTQLTRKTNLSKSKPKTYSWSTIFNCHTEIYQELRTDERTHTTTGRWIFCSSWHGCHPRHLFSGWIATRFCSTPFFLVWWTIQPRLQDLNCKQKQVLLCFFPPHKVFQEIFMIPRTYSLECRS